MLRLEWFFWTRWFPTYLSEFWHEAWDMAMQRRALLFREYER